MSKIIQLPEQLISKIAAGEVIERPVYAVKELIENAIDAQATSIIIHIEQAGLRTITVIDDGEGMSPEDLQNSIKHHATSKLIDEDMLSHIPTLGFRGEALSSIAAISDLSISTKREENAIGTTIKVVNGEIVHSGPIGIPAGTHITVSNLFSSVPARKKFLKSEKTEFRLIAELVTQYALAHPHIRFSLMHNGKQVLDLPKLNNIHERVYLLFGKDIFTSLINLSHQDEYISMSGFLAKPPVASATSGKQHIFVNGRNISDKLISQIIREQLGTLLEKTQYPIFVLFLTIPYELVDVNIHPRKETIRFSNQQLLVETIQKAVQKTLEKNSISYSNSLFGEEPESSVFSKSGTTKTYAADMVRDHVVPWDIRQKEKLLTTDIIHIHNLYILTQTIRGFVLIDQHAAHERILYEQFSKEFQKQRKSTEQFTLKKPRRLELSIGDSNLIEEYQSKFSSLGITLEHFGGTTYLITAVPMLLKDRDHKTLLEEMLEELREEKEIGKVDKISQRMLAYLACRSAVMAGEKLNKKQMKELVEKLETTQNNLSCPHGRPTKIAVSLDQLHKLFKRK